MPKIVIQNLIPVDKSWQQQLAQCITDPEKLLDYLNIVPEQYRSSFAARKLFPVRVPLPFVERMERGNPNDPLLKQVMTSSDEFIQQPGFSDDPLDEQQPPLPGLLHKYKNRVLLMVRTACAINCRYCFRRHFPYQGNSIGSDQLADIAQYVAADNAINEVILSGGDPLMANDDHLKKIFDLIEPIEHVSRLRIHTRLPVVIPARVTQQLVEICSRTRLNVVVVLHINHANEINQEFTDSIQQLRTAGVTLLNQAVLLKSINDDVASQVALNEKLFTAGILPYYLHLLDRVNGASHFDSDEQQAIALMHQLYKNLPGFLVPKLVREIGGQAHKTPIDLGLAPEI